MAISALRIPKRASTVFHILPRVLLTLFQIASFALHLVLCLGSLRAGNVLPLPRKLPVLLLNL